MAERFLSPCPTLPQILRGGPVGPCPSRGRLRGEVGVVPRADRSGRSCVSACTLPATARLLAALQYPQSHVNFHLARRPLESPRAWGPATNPSQTPCDLGRISAFHPRVDTPQKVPPLLCCP